MYALAYFFPIVNLECYWDFSNVAGYYCLLSYPSLHLVSYLDRKNMFLTFTEDNAFVTL